MRRVEKGDGDSVSSKEKQLQVSFAPDLSGAEMVKAKLRLAIVVTAAALGMLLLFKLAHHVRNSDSNGFLCCSNLVKLQFFACSVMLYMYCTAFC